MFDIIVIFITDGQIIDVQKHRYERSEDLQNDLDRVLNYCRKNTELRVQAWRVFSEGPSTESYQLLDSDKDSSIESIKKKFTNSYFMRPIREEKEEKGIILDFKTGNRIQGEKLVQNHS